MRFVFFVKLLFALPLWALAQGPQLAEARRIIDTLCRLDGRGYVDSADWRAARFIAGYVQHAGLLPLGSGYYQPFPVSVNTFPGPVALTIDDRELQAGRDFLVDPASPSLKGTYLLQVANLTGSDTSLQALEPLIRSLLKGKPRALLLERNRLTDKQYDLLREVLLNARTRVAVVLEVRSGKLTWHVANRQQPPAWLVLAEKAVPSKPRRIKISISAQFKPNYLTCNVAAYVPGRSVADSFVVFTAHYDHLGCLGPSVCFPGANDNASGVSLLLQLAAYYAKNPSRYSMAFLFFGAEELGLLGSRYFIANPLLPMESIRFLINLDIVGTGDEGIKVVNASVHTGAFQQLVDLNERLATLPAVLPRGPAANSDHFPFYQRGVPCFFIYTLGGIAAYHDIYDRSETLPLTEYADLFRLLVAFAAQLSRDAVPSDEGH
ncbi:MAG: M28 family peptidase [Chitinophagales bacterium]|nr:M28 family peptidase [Chitinophagales bacterium]